MIKEICWDMDGTMADLYEVNGWLDDLRNENPRPYIEAEPIWDMTELVFILSILREQGIKIRVISWLSMDSTEEYKTEVRKAKRDWLDRFGFEYDYCNLVQYGTRKQSVIRNRQKGEYILIDDNAEVRDTWNIGRTVNPTEVDIIEYLRELALGVKD